jgi:hypothetical protein
MKGPFGATGFSEKQIRAEDELEHCKGGALAKLFCSSDSIFTWRRELRHPKTSSLGCKSQKKMSIFSTVLDP